MLDPPTGSKVIRLAGFRPLRTILRNGTENGGHMKRKQRESGNAFVELAFILPILTSLFIGVSVLGVRLVKELALTQVARDAASMYARSVDFSMSSNQALLTRVGTLLGWPQSTALSSTDPGVVYLSKIMYIDGTCNGLPVTDSKGRTCNKNSWVFLNTIIFGNTSIHTSNFGAPPACISACYESVIDNLSTNQGDINVNEAYYNSQDKVSNFTYLGTPATGTPGFQPAQVANLVEVAAYVGTNVNYAVALF
jgi:hypothetical protein